VSFGRDDQVHISTWRHMKIFRHGQPVIMHGVFRMLLVPVKYRRGLFHLRYEVNGKPVNQRLYTRNWATEKLREMFQEQLTEWEPYEQR
jgi:hypothetical protein